MLDPVAGIVDGSGNIHRNAPCIDADIPRCLTVGARPAPDLTEHLLVQGAQEALVEHLTSARR
jgi:hypothetical protein